VRSMEFIQFHPTGLYIPGESGRTFLISESVRGEGGLLKNSSGERFMVGKHELAELAPRDIVARGIFRELERSGEQCVYIDMTAEDEEHLKKRYPTIYGECLRRGINISKDRIPVSPVQHYMIGGIAAGLNSMSTVDGLYACGEAASTGVHGANRLASNSMLECLVYGRRAAESINAASAAARPTDFELPRPSAGKLNKVDAPALREKIRAVMSETCWVIRTEKGLRRGLKEISGILKTLSEADMSEKSVMELLNMAQVAHEILAGALARRESVGAHYRED